jgi:hypothetical protein
VNQIGIANGCVCRSSGLRSNDPRKTELAEKNNETLVRLASDQNVHAPVPSKRRDGKPLFNPFFMLYS